VKPAPFAYERAVDIEEATDVLSRYGADGKVLAGGQSLVPLLNLRLARPSVLVDINAVPGLDAIEVDGDTVHLGALVRQSDLQRSQVVAERVPLLREAMRYVGHAQIRNRGTVGGSVAHADPAAELPACLVALGARFRLRSQRGERAVVWAEFFRGPLTTALTEDEVLTGIEVPLPPAGSGQAFVEFARRQGDFALGGAGAIVALDNERRCRHVGVGLLAAGGTPVRATAAEMMLAGNQIDERLAQEAAEETVRSLCPLHDVHGSREFRRRVIGELVRRALLLSASRAEASSQ
jgi:CO/xanthine dehydrogenase FAD-binding subunit